MTTPDPVRHALELIATASPTLHHCGSVDRWCTLCATHIDLAREALGWAPLPTAPRTPASDGQRT